MTLQCALVASDLNEEYINFYPIVHRAWRKVVGVTAKLILIADHVPASLKHLQDDIILFPPIDGIHTAFQAQCIRLLYPAILPGVSEGRKIIISDMDIIPMSKEYFTLPVEHWSNDTFIVYRSDALPPQTRQFPMCYNAAAPHVWRAIFDGISSVEDVRNKLAEWHGYCQNYDGRHGGVGWNFDQLLLRFKLEQCEKENLQINIAYLADAEMSFLRLDRADLMRENRLTENMASLIANKKYSDYHMLRPNHQFRNQNYAILNMTSCHFSIHDRHMSNWVYGTHIAPLMAAVLNTSGPVLELGCGDYSTTLLHEVCKSQRRFLLSTDTSRAFLTLFQDLSSSDHVFKHVPVYEDDENLNPIPERWDEIGQEVEGGHWGVVFVDHRPGERRVVDVRRFANRADIIVVHDTEAAGYSYESAFLEFKYRYDYRRYAVHTTLLSNTIDISALFL